MPARAALIRLQSKIKPQTPTTEAVLSKTGTGNASITIECPCTGANQYQLELSVEIDSDERPRNRATVEPSIIAHLSPLSDVTQGPRQIFAVSV